MTDDFYIGYDTAVPRSSRSRVFGAVGGALATMLAAGLVIIAGQSLLPAASFEYGTTRTFAGTLSTRPYPVLETAAGDYWLVGIGKHGAAEMVRGFDGKRVTIEGTLIERGPYRMIEITGVTELAGAPDAGSPRAALEDFGDVTLTGEVVDGKCFFGVMNPGEGIVHRDCARACLRGDVPAFFSVEGTSGERRVFVLTNAAGGAATGSLAHLAGVRVTLAGRAFFQPSTGRWTLRLSGQTE